MDQLDDIRERLKALPDPFAFLTGLFAHSPVAFQVYKADGHCLLTNRAFRELFGSEPPPEYNVLQDDVAEARGILGQIRRAFAGETIQTPPFWYDPRELKQVHVTEGRRVAISATFFPLFRSEGEVSHVGIAFKDVTSEFEARQAAEVERDLLRSIIEQSGDGIIVADQRGALRLFNPEAERQHGRGMQDVPLVEWPQRYGLETVEDIPMKPEETAMARAVRGERVEGARWQVRRPDGSVRLLSGTASPLRRSDGTIAGAVLTCRDETEQVRARQALENQQKWLEAVLDRMPVAVVISEPASGELVFSNAAADRMNGAPLPRHQPPQSYGELFNVTDSEGHPLHMEELPIVRAARGEKFDGLEVVWHTHAGTFDLLMSAETLPAMHGHPAVAVVPFQDITTLKKTEGALKEALHARDEFLSIASHELRTPLTTLKLQLQSTKRGMERSDATLPPDRLRRFVETAERQVQRLARLVDDMLDISRIALGKLSLHPDRFDLVELVSEVVERVGPQLAAAECTVRVQAPVPVVGEWDRFRIDQVLTNLLTNAARYGAGKPVEIEVSATPAEAVISVRDFGRGIDPKDHERIFQRFERAISSYEISGLGLGLYIVRQILLMHGGSIHVESELEKGARFIVRLPLKTQAA